MPKKKTKSKDAVNNFSCEKIISEGYDGKKIWPKQYQSKRLTLFSDVRVFYYEAYFSPEFNKNSKELVVGLTA